MPVPKAITVYFDPACPWTWMTARWLCDISSRHGVDLKWRAFSLAMANEGNLPEHFKPRVAMSRRALRVVETLAADGRHADTSRFYAELGRRVHVEEQETNEALVDASLEAVGLDELRAAAADPGADERVRGAFEEARRLAGSDVGSPILAFPEQDAAWFGPLVSPVPTGEDADRLWELVVAAVSLPQFFELKRRRNTPPRVRG